MDRRPGVRRDGCHGEDVTHEMRVHPQSRGASDLPEDPAVPSPVKEADVAVRRRDERRGGLEHEYRIGIALSVEGESAGDLERAAGRIVDTGKQGGTAKLGGDAAYGRSPGGVVVCGHQVILGHTGGLITQVQRPSHRYARLSGERSARIESDVSASVSVDRGRSGIRDRRAGQDGKTGG